MASIVVKPNRRYKYHSLRHEWTEIMRVDFREIPSDIPLTHRAINHWTETKSPLGYTNFLELSRSDILSILSAAKRNEAFLNVEGWGRIAYYMLRIKR